MSVNGFEVKLVAIDSDRANLDLIVAALAPLKIEISSATSAVEGLEAIQRTAAEIVLAEQDTSMSGSGDLLESIIDLDPGITVILMANLYSTELAVDAIQRGAYDYLDKPLDADRLRQKIDRWMEDAQLRRHTANLDKELAEAYQFQNIVGRSPLMLEVFSRVRRVAPHFQTVLITGETGTGKELVARALHQSSPVAAKPFVTCNCSAIVDTLFESELFGYVKGAFTGATQDKMGLFEHAQGGTLFLDEIGDIPPTTQAKLLRVLQNQEVQRVGAAFGRKVNARVIAATNHNLRARVASKEFREDLYYRLSMVEIALPSLAQRKEDLPLLERHFLRVFSLRFNRTIRGLTRRAQVLLAQHTWPGNVRELENVLGYACMMASKNVIDLSDLPAYLTGPPQAGPEPADDGLLSMDEMQRRHAAQVLIRAGGNRVRAAKILGIARGTLYRLLGDEKEFGHEQALVN